MTFAFHHRHTPLAACVAIASAAAFGGQETPAARPAQSTAAQEEVTPDIVVLARKLRTVRLRYSVDRKGVRDCSAERSSGDRRVDRIMCAILRACVAEGASEVGPAKLCMMRKIDSLDDPAPQPRTIAGAAPPLPPPVLAPTPLPPPSTAAVTPQRSDVVVTARRVPDDITVVGGVPVLRGGLWRFDRAGTISYGGGGSTRPVTFTMCIPDGGMEDMLRAAATQVDFGAVGQSCNRLSTRIGPGRLSGHRSCYPTGGQPRRLAVSARFDTARLVINYLEEVDHEGLTRGGGVGFNPGRPIGARWRVEARRAQDCPAKPPPNQRSPADAAALLFSSEPPIDG